VSYINQIFAFWPKFPAQSVNTTRLAIIEKYANWNNVNNIYGNLLGLDQTYGDQSIVCNSNDWALFYAQQGLDVYFYQFNQLNVKYSFAEPYFGVVHSNEIPFVFGYAQVSILADSFTKDEASLSGQMLSNWINFAAFGKLYRILKIKFKLSLISMNL
jgi:carboxylesterase type B